MFDKSFEATERVFNFCAFAQEHFNNGDLRKKREIFGTVGSNLILKDRKLIVEKLHPYLLIESELRSQKKLYSRLEPKKDGYTKEKEAVFAASLPSWLRVVDEITTYFKTTSNYHYIPNLKDGIYPLVRPTSEQLALA